MGVLLNGTGAARSAVHHVLSSMIITIYGYHVCNFINGLEVQVWAATLLPVLLAQWLLRNLIAGRISKFSIVKRPQLAFWGELSSFIAGGATVGAINTVFHGFPVASGLMAVLGFVTIGLFAGVDQAFVQTRIRFQQGGMPSFPAKPRSPLAIRLGFSFGLVLILVIGVITLLILRGLENGTVQDAQGFRRLVIEFTFVFAVILCYVANAAWGAEKLLAMAVAEQVQTLGEARDGRAQRRAVIGTQDEIGFVSAEINHLLDELDKAHETTTRTNDAIMKSLIGLAGARDNETGDHLHRTQQCVGILCTQISGHPDHAAMTHEEARQILIDGAGTQFDPLVVAAFLVVEPQFESIATSFADPTQVPTSAAA